MIYIFAIVCQYIFSYCLIHFVCVSCVCIYHNTVTSLVLKYHHLAVGTDDVKYQPWNALKLTVW